MSLQERVNEVVPRLRAAKTDLADVEVKLAEGGVPKSLPETISAFANGTGGLILLGLDEKAGFQPVDIDAPAISVAVAGHCRDNIDPSVMADIDIVTVDGKPVVAAMIPPGDRLRLPYYVKTQGLERGSYLRSHDGDRHLTSYEVHALVAGRGQPRDDQAVVPGATINDLNPELVAALIRRLRTTRGPVFENASDTDVLRFVQVLAREPKQELVTLAGLLTLGRYPQQFFPQLDISFVVFPTTRAGVQMVDGTRFLDNASLDGPIPLMIEQALAALRRNMTRRAVIQGFGREDRWEYPEEVVRELLGNAVMHRDYYPLTHGSQIRMEMYPDRLEVSSPGGLFGNILPDELLNRPASSSRNSALAKLLEDVSYPGTNKTVCENRGTGLLTVSNMMRQAGLEQPEVVNHITQFTIILRNTVGTNSVPVAANRETTTVRRQQLLALLSNGPLTTTQLAEAMGLQQVTIRHHLREMEQAGQVEPTESKKHNRNNAWRVSR